MVRRVAGVVLTSLLAAGAAQGTPAAPVSAAPAPGSGPGSSAPASAAKKSQGPLPAAGKRKLPATPGNKPRVTEANETTGAPIVEEPTSDPAEE